MNNQTTTYYIPTNPSIKNYNQLLKINKNQQNIKKSITNKIELFINDQKKYIEELTKLEKEYNTISKLISIKGDNNE